ncbi:MAG TPA: hypothetical protein VN539_07025 [Candidatus Saccharimonadales bacterium]|nr:hypothetical protein [Candidatus Saccharimonadales bacterium]
MNELRRHEERDLSVRVIVIFAVALVAFGLAAQGLVGALFTRYHVREKQRDTPPSPLREAKFQPSAPRLQVNPAGDLETIRRREKQLLSSYGWVDRDHGTVRIPVDQAMKRIAERGLPSRPAPRSAD